MLNFCMLFSHNNGKTERILGNALFTLMLPSVAWQKSIGFCFPTSHRHLLPFTQTVLQEKQLPTSPLQNSQSAVIIVVLFDSLGAQVHGKLQIIAKIIKPLNYCVF